MVIIEQRDCYEVFTEFKDAGLLNDTTLYGEINENDLWNSFDNLLSLEFPHGTDESEYIDFYNNEAEYIREHI